MPRTEGVSSSSRTRRILFRPRPIRVSFWPGLRPATEWTWVTRTLGMRRLLGGRRAGWGLTGGGLAGLRLTCLRLTGRVAAAENLSHFLAAASGDGAGTGAMLQRVERRLDHVV